MRLSLRQRTLLVILIALTGVAVMLASFSRIVLRRFEQIERVSVEQHLLRVSEALDEAAAKLDSSCGTNAEWDDLYEKPAAEIPEFMRGNFPPESLRVLDADTLVLVDQHGRTQFSMSVEPRSYTAAPPPAPADVTAWTRPLLDPAHPLRKRVGLVSHGSGLLVVAARRVSRSDAGGESHGVLVEARHVDAVLLAHWRELTHLPFELVPIATTAGAELARRVRAGGGANGLIWVSRSPQQICGARLVRGADGQPLATVLLRLPRTQYELGRHAMLFYAFSTLLGGLVLSLLLLYYLDHNLLRRVQSLYQMVHRMARAHAGAVGAPSRHGDEVGELVDGVAELLEELDASQRALVANRANLQQLYDSLQDYVFILASDGGLLGANSVVKRLAYEGDGLRLQDYLRATGAAPEVLAEFLAGDRTGALEGEFLATDGRTIVVELRLTTSRWDQRDVLIAVGHDVTEQRRMEVALMRRDRVLEGVAQALGALVGGRDLDAVLPAVLWTLGRVTDTEMVSLIPAGLAGEPPAPLCQWFAEGVDPASLTACRSRLDEAVLSGLAARSRCQVPMAELVPEAGEKPGGYVLALSVRCHGGLWGYLALGACHTTREWHASEEAILQFAANGIAVSLERQREEAEIRAARRAVEEAAERKVATIAAVSALYLALDVDDRLLEWSAPTAALLGSGAGLTAGKRLDELVIDWDWERVLAAVQRCRNGESAVAEMLALRRGESEYVLNVTSALVPGARPTVVLVGRDFTERHRLQEQLAQAQKLEAIGQLAAGVAHEINTPTQYVGDNVSYLKDGVASLAEVVEAYRALEDAASSGGDVAAAAQLAAEARQRAKLEFLLEDLPAAVDDALEGVGRISSIVRAMKEFSHPGGGEPTEVDLNRAVANTITVSRNEWKYHAELAADLDPDLPKVWCLPGEVNQVVLNLIVNAAHAVADRKAHGDDSPGRITVSTRQTADQVVIRVADNGAGIPEHVRHRVFDPFFTTKDVGTGTGQGLAIARTIVVEKHGGQIEFETSAAGTTFSIRLPIEPTGVQLEPVA